MKNKLVSLLIVVAMVTSGLGGLVVMASDDMVNVALHQAAVASTVCDSNHDASFANDGINDNAEYTYWLSGSGDTNPYWEVDLGVSYKISRIELEARMNADEHERKNIRIVASDTKKFDDATELALIEDADYGEMYVKDVTKKMRFRYVRVEKTDAKPLSIGELRVLVEKDSILQGMDAVGFADQIPASDEAGRYMVPTDVKNTPFEKDVALLCALNIMRGYPDGDFLPYEPITRSEFAAVAMRLLGYDMKSTSRTFMDVTSEHWAYNEIETAARFGIVNGVGGDLFKPDDMITTSQVIKILVELMGYGEVADIMGGYPEGHREVALKTGLMKDISIEGGENINRGEIAMLICNAIECDIMVMDSFGTTVSGSAVEGNTILTEYLGIYKSDGIVTRAGNSALTTVVDSADENIVEIDGILFDTNISNIEEYLGYSVDYYYEEDDATGREKVIAVFIKDKNNTTIIPAENLIKVSENKLYYEIDNKKEKFLTLAADMDLIYNGVARRIYDSNTDLVPTTGSAKLIDNDGDRSIDVYIVNKIDNYVVNWVNAADELIYTKNATKALDLDSDKNVVVITSKSSGKTMTLSEISEWNIISVMESANDSGMKHYRIIVSDELVRGSLEKIYDDYVVVAGRNFEIASIFDVSDIALGSKGVFYLDAEGKIAAFDGDIKPGERYGFLKNVGYLDDAFDEHIAFRIFTDDGVFKNFNATERFTLNGNIMTDVDEIRDCLLTTGMEGTTSQAIKYTVTGKGEISSMLTASGELSKDFDAEAASPAPITSGKGYYYNAAGVFDSAFSMDTETVIVELPTGDLSREKDYTILSPAGIRSGRYYYAQAFDTGEERIAKLIVFTGGASSDASDSTTFFIVDSLEEVLLDEGDTFFKVSGLYKGEMQSYLIDEDVEVNTDDFYQGSVLTLAFAGDVITDYEVKFYRGEKPEDAPNASVSTETPQYGANVQGLMGICWYGYGMVETKKSGIIRVSFENVDVPNPGSSIEFTNYPELVANLSSIGRIYRYDSENEKIEVVNASYVLDKATVGSVEASRVLLRADSGNILEMVIFD